jgi:hypothetical protein
VFPNKTLERTVTNSALVTVLSGLNFSVGAQSAFIPMI